MAKGEVEIVIPFDGFYNTLHDSELDDALEQMFRDHETGAFIHESLLNQAYELVDWRAVQLAYVQEYVSKFREEFELDTLKFVELESPREYNFVTDRIICTIGYADRLKMLREIKSDDLAKLVEQRHSHRSGFISFYSPSLDEWKRQGPSNWDLNQWATVLLCYVDMMDSDFDQMAQLDLMDFWRCNGRFENAALHGNPKLERLVNIYDYLERRKERGLS